MNITFIINIMIVSQLQSIIKSTEDKLISERIIVKIANPDVSIVKVLSLFNLLRE